MNKMTVLLVGLAFVAIAVASFFIWYLPYKEANIKELEKRETGKFSRKIKFPTKALGNGTAVFKIVGSDYQPFLTDGKGAGILHIPNEKGRGDVIIETWVEEDEMKIKMVIYDNQRQIVTMINGNDWVVNKSSKIDCNLDLEAFEVVSLENSNTIPILQIQLLSTHVDIAFETYLSGGMGLFWGKNRMELTGENHKTLNNDLKAIFKYPSNENFGRRND
jgi:hypothetical protein